ncbi:hypothetical protein DOU54_04715 [Agrobacterium sp. MS2]|nr:hypothetical protein DOU54_04715 [Agrobacterium sp. MS2]
MEAMHARRYSVATLAGEMCFSIISIEHSAFDCSALADDHQKTRRTSKARASRPPIKNTRPFRAVVSISRFPADSY